VLSQSHRTNIIVFSDLHISKFTGYFNEQACINGMISIARDKKKSRGNSA
jgi:hypothetical protein